MLLWASKSWHRDSRAYWKLRLGCKACSGACLILQGLLYIFHLVFGIYRFASVRRLFLSWLWKVISPFVVLLCLCFLILIFLLQSLGWFFHELQPWVTMEMWCCRGSKTLLELSQGSRAGHFAVASSRHSFTIEAMDPQQVDLFSPSTMQFRGKLLLYLINHNKILQHPPSKGVSDTCIIARE